MRPDFEQFFRGYAELYNQALTDRPDYQAIADCFSPCFAAAGPTGVECGKNDAEFRATLRKGYEFYKRIGARRMSTRRCLVTEIDATHFMVKVYYRAEHQKPCGAAVTIDFDVTYLIDAGSGSPRIFAFIAGDEMGEYRRAGLLA